MKTRWAVEESCVVSVVVPSRVKNPVKRLIKNRVDTCIRKRLLSETFVRAGVRTGVRAGIALAVACGTMAAATLGLAATALAYGGDGHEVVAELAFLELKNHTPQGQSIINRVNGILANGETWGQASQWADDVKVGNRPRNRQVRSSPDGRAFLNKVDAAFGDREHHNNWHFVNVPHQLAVYDRNDPWTRNDDIVQMIRLCAQTLRDGQSPNDAPISLTQREALRLLIHYVGDLHQPLHIGCGYPSFRQEGGGTESVRFVVPTLNNQNRLRPSHDLGGNSWTVPVKTRFRFPHNNRLEPREAKLHSYWDTHLVMLVRDVDPDDTSLHRSNKQLAEDLSRFEVRFNTATWKTSGALSVWSKKWADDSLELSKQAYGGVIFRRITENGTRKSIGILPDTPANNYESQSAQIVRTQLAKGGFHLAEILKAVFLP